MGDQINKIANEQDASVFRSLFLTFCPKVRAMLIRQGTDRETAEEIAQDTMFAVWRKSHQFSDDRGSISAWIYAIARNLRIDRVRRQAVWQRCHEELEKMERLQPSLVEPRSWEQEKDEIEGALSCLPPEQMQVIQLSFVDGLSQNEISERLDLPLGTVKSRMRLAFDRLRSSAENRA